MSQECVEINEKIEYYSLLAARVTEPDLLDGIEEVLEHLHAIRAILKTSN
jgi:hypothetical protein